MRSPPAPRTPPTPPARPSLGWRGSRFFLALSLACAGVASALLLRDEHRMEGVLALACALYFALRLFGRLGRPRG